MTENAYAPSIQFQGFSLIGTRDRLGLSDFFENFDVGFIENVSLSSSKGSRMTDFFRASTEVTFNTVDETFAFTSSNTQSSSNTVEDFTASTLTLDKNRWMGSICPPHGIYNNVT